MADEPSAEHAAFAQQLAAESKRAPTPVQPKPATPATVEEQPLPGPASPRKPAGGELLTFDMGDSPSPRKAAPRKFKRKKEEEKKNTTETVGALHSDMIKGEPLKYNEGDEELEPYFSPLLRQAGGSL